jgi:hypothetical protein
MSERNAFILFIIGIVVLTMVWMLGLNALGADDETLAAASILLFPIAGF